MNDPRYTTRFITKAHIYHPSLDEAKEARASLDQLKDLLPPDINPERDVDIVYFVGNLAVPGLMNANDDGVTVSDGIALAKGFERRLVDIEHNRKQLVGFIVKGGLSELGTNRLITEDEARAANKPFNIAIAAAIWKVVDKDLANFILGSTLPGSTDKDALSLSFEVGFNDYDIAVLPPGVTTLAMASQVIKCPAGCDHDDETLAKMAIDEFEKYDKMLRVNKGKGTTKDGGRIGRMLRAPLVPLGAGIVTVPAAQVKGIEAVLTSVDAADSPDSAQDEAKSTIKPESEAVYIDADDLSMATKIKLPAGLVEKAKSLNYPKVNVTLSDGRVLKDVTVFNGEELDLDKELADLQGVVITDMTPCLPPGADDSPVIHPHVGEQFPTKTPEAREDGQWQGEEKTHEVLRNLPYTDAILKHLEAAAKILRIIETNSSVLSSTTNDSTSTTSSMKLEDLKQLEAKAKNATKPEEIAEVFANVSLFAEEIMKASEKFAKAADDAKKDKDEAVKTSEAIKKDLEETKSALAELKATQAAVEAQAKFQERMTSIAEIFDLDDEVRAFVVEEVRACVDDASFEKYLAKAKKVMKGSIKTKNEKTADDDNSGSGKGPGGKKAPQDVDSQESKSDGLGIKHGDKDTVTSSKKDDEPVKKDDKSDDDDDDKKAAKAALASAASNPTDKLNIDLFSVEGNISLRDQYMKAFAENTSVGGRKVKDFVSPSKK